MGEEKVKKILYYLKKRKTFNEIQELLSISQTELIGIIKLMNEQGYMYDYSNGQIIKLDKPNKEEDIYRIPSQLDHIKLLLLSDTHLASKYDRVDILRYIYEKAEDIGIDYIMHSGDIVDGLSGRPQQMYELKEASYTGQRDYVIDKYPKSDIPTYMISGNHDLWWVRQCGADIVKDICSKRDDLHYLGSDCEDLMIGKLRVRLYHGAKGQSYAKSYRLQKYLDSIPSEELPHILQTGHIHQSFYMKQGKTHCFQTSCLQDLTPFERSQGYNNDKSVWWIDITMDNKGEPIEVRQELETFGNKLIRKRNKTL